jgi:hypothetical protein
LERVTAEPSYSVPLQSDACDLARQGAEGGWGDAAFRGGFVGGGDTQYDVFLAGSARNIYKKRRPKEEVAARIGATGRSGTAGLVRSGAAAALCHHPRVRDFLRSQGTHRLRRHGHDRDCFPRQGHKFDLVTGASRMDHHNPADVARL